MSNFLGVDLGTTNSAICSYDGKAVTVHRTQEQQLCMPTAIYFDRRGKYYGARAYQMAAVSPSNTAVLFKRLMGTDAKIQIPSVGLTLSPEQCSAEILKALLGLLPEDFRNAPAAGTVITVPAAFNQMQRNATLAAAELADIGRVTLMQEPVAAVMSVVKERTVDGTFLVYDFGGGTLDVAIAQSVAGRVSLLEHGGVEMCGGRDFDRALVEKAVKPWLVENFDLPINFSEDPNFQRLVRLCEWAAEHAKIQLSSREKMSISLSEDEIRITDLRGTEIFVDVEVSRARLMQLMQPKLEEAVESIRRILRRADLGSDDIDRIVFIGGPTIFGPHRDFITSQLGIPGDTSVDPMTAVAVGASIFAEALDWSESNSVTRKKTTGTTAVPGKATFTFGSRTAQSSAKIRAGVEKGAQIAEFQVDNVASSWTSGRLLLVEDATVEVPLSTLGEHNFTVTCYASSGKVYDRQNIIITRTSPVVHSIPASHSIGVEVKESLAHSATSLEYLVRAGDKLPLKGRKRFKATEKLKSGSTHAILLRLWEGEIDYPVSDNLFVGCLKISGQDFQQGEIQMGADLYCDYSIADSGAISVQMTVPSIGCTFAPEQNFYSRQEGQLDFSQAKPLLLGELDDLKSRLQRGHGEGYSGQLSLAADKISAVEKQVMESSDAESLKQARDHVQAVKVLLFDARLEGLVQAREVELAELSASFQELCRDLATSSELTTFDTLTKTGSRLIPERSQEFDGVVAEMRGTILGVLLRQDWFILHTFKGLASGEHLFMDPVESKRLIEDGNRAVCENDPSRLREIVGLLYSIRLPNQSSLNLSSLVNIMRA